MSAASTSGTTIARSGVRRFPLTASVLQLHQVLTPLGRNPLHAILIDLRLPAGIPLGLTELRGLDVKESLLF